MNIHEVIRNRRSVGKVKQDPVDKSLIERMLEAAVWAPNHYHTEPWKFFVFTGDGRRALGRTMAEIAQDGMTGPDMKENRDLLKKQEEKAFRAPVIIAAAAVRSDNSKVPWIEELAAVHCAVQNILLTAHALGLGAIWRTGDAAYHPRMKTLFGLRDIDELTGFIYVGHPNSKQIEAKRGAFSEKTKWIDEAVF